MRSDFIEVSLRTDADSGELLGMLKDAETLGSWEKDGVVHIFWPEERWNDSTLNDLKRVMSQLGIEEHESDLKITHVPDQDWNAVWAASLKPIRLGRGVRIRQSWHEADSAFNGIELVIDPRRAFGTGYHTSTQLVIEWLEDHIVGGERVLDVGTGSGILSMVAIRLGAAYALGIDNDSVAVDCAREYARFNGFGAELDLCVASFEALADEPFDVVVANMDSRTMPLFCKKIGRLLKPGGAACLSGIQDQDYEEITELLGRIGVIKKRKRDEWLSLSLHAFNP